MVSHLGVAEPPPGCLGLNPQAERAKDAKNALKLSALQGALLFQPDGFNRATYLRYLLAIIRLTACLWGIPLDMQSKISSTQYRISQSQ